MIFSTAPEFDRELKNFTKKWRSLKTDFDSVYKTLPRLYEIQPKETVDELKQRRLEFFNNKRATILNDAVAGKELVKMRLDCASLGDKDMLRLVFVFVYIKIAGEIKFIEIFSKNEKSREDIRRIQKYL